MIMTTETTIETIGSVIVTEFTRLLQPLPVHMMVGQGSFAKNAFLGMTNVP